MTTTIVLDKAGRVVIPKLLRDELNIGPGDSFELESEGDRIRLRPVRGTMPLRKERGVWVFRTSHPLPATVTDETMRMLREERDRGNLGKAR